MPIYEYECATCGDIHEALQKISDPPLTDCTRCGASTLTKRVTAAAFRLAGSGWYETDFKQDKKRNLKESSGPETTGAGDSAGGSARSGTSPGTSASATPAPSTATGSGSATASASSADTGSGKGPAGSKPGAMSGAP